MEHSDRDLKVHWLDSGGEHRPVISQPFHFQGHSICGGIIIVNLHPWGFKAKVITELLGQERSGKGIWKGPEQVGKHRKSLWLSHSGFFCFMKCLLLRGVYLGSYKLPDVQKTSRNPHMAGDKTCHFKFPIPLGRTRLVFILYLKNASRKSLCFLKLWQVL